MRQFRKIILMIAAFGLLLSCESGGDTKARPKKEKAMYKSGNLYGSYGKQLTVNDIINSIIASDITLVTGIVMNTRWFAPKTFWVFTEKEGEGDGFYTGPKEKGGPVYTWYAHKEEVWTLKEMCEKVSWQKPVYISYENKSIPLTAYVDESGNLVSGVGKNVDKPIYVGLDTIRHADIWYCYGMGNDIKNQYYRLSAYSVAIGECAFAQAEANSLLLKDIARLTGAKAGLSEFDTDVELSDEEINAIAAKVDQLDDAIKDKLKINRQLTNAIGGAVMASINEGTKLAGQIALDALQVAAYVLDPESLANYIIQTYGPTKEMQTLGKLADKQSDANYKYGSSQLKLAKEMLKKQKAQFDAIINED